VGVRLVRRGGLAFSGKWSSVVDCDRMRDMSSDQDSNTKDEASINLPCPLSGDLRGNSSVHSRNRTRANKSCFEVLERDFLDES
jgi:hypothetical protein